MAGLIKRNGTYYAQFYDKFRRPKRKRLSLRTKRKRPARRLLDQLEDDYATGMLDPWLGDPRHYKRETLENVSYGEARDRFLRRKKKDGLRKSSLRTYRAILRLFAEQVGEAADLRRVSAANVRSFVRNPSVSKATRRKRYGHLRAFLRWCRSEKLLQEDPAGPVEPPAKPRKLPKAITERQVDQVCGEVRRDYERKRKQGNAREGQLIWRIPLFQFAFCTGMRGAEIARLRWGHIDFGKRLIYVYEQKNGKEQTIPLNGRAESVLAGLEKGRAEDFVFHSPYIEARERNARSFRERASEAFRRARDRLDMDERLSLHSLRHGFCTRLAEAGKPLHIIKEAARHADVSTSMIYVHMANKHLKSEIDDVFGT